MRFSPQHHLADGDTPANCSAVRPGTDPSHLVFLHHERMIDSFGDARQWILDFKPGGDASGRGCWMGVRSGQSQMEHLRWLRILLGARPAASLFLPPPATAVFERKRKKKKKKKERSGYQSINCQCAVTHAHRGSERLCLFWLAIAWRTQCWGAGTWQPCYPVIRSSRKVRRHAAVRL